MKKIGKLNGKVVVAGDKNLVTANQIHYEEKDGNITLSERKGGELNSVTGSNGKESNTSDILYYKVVESDEVVNFMDKPTTCYELVKQFNRFPYIAQFISIIMLNPETSKYEKMYKQIQTTSSGDLTDSINADMMFTYAFPQGVAIKGFCIYKEETSVYIAGRDSRYALKIKEGTIIDKLVNMAELSGEEELLEPFIIAFEKCFIPISKEEYNALCK